MSKKNKSKNTSNKRKEALSENDVLTLANLVRLQLDDEQIKLLQGQLVETIDYVQNLGELDTSEVEDLTSATDSKNVTFEDGTVSERSFSQSDALSNASRSEDGFFIVDKILDK